MSKQFQVGDEIEALCGVCKSATVHVIETIKNDQASRVLCKSCLSSHRFKSPEEPAPKARVKKEPKVMTPATKASRQWSRLMAKSDQDAPRGYQMNEKYAQNDVILHEKFGRGVVVNVIDPSKISVVFEEGAKTLIHNRA